MSAGGNGAPQAGKPIATERRQALLHTILERLTRELDPDVIIQQALEAIVGLSCWQDVGISLPTSDGRHWQSRAASGFAPGEVGPLHSFETGVIGRAYRTGELQFVADVTGDPDFFLGVGDTPVGSELVIPIKFDGEVIGAINLEWEQQAAFDQDDVAFAQSIAQIVAIALKNAQRFTSLRHEMAERTRREAWFATIFQRSPIAIVITRLSDNLLLDVNDAWLQLHGYTRDEVMGRTILELGLWANLAERQRLLATLEARGSVTNFEAEIYHRSGRRLSVLVSAELTRLGDEPCVLFQLMDITERKEAEALLRQSEAHYRYLFEHNPHPMWAYDLETLRFLAVNDAAVAKYGYTRDEFLRMTIADIRPPDDLERLREDLAQPRQAIQHSGCWRHRLSDGRLIDVEISSHTLQLFDRPAALVVAQDVTARTQAEAALRASEARFATIFEHSPVAIAMTNLRANMLVQVNAAFLALTGYERDEVIGQTSSDLRLWAAPEDRERMFVSLRQRQIVRGFETALRQRAGVERQVLLSGDVVEIGGDDYALIQLTDVTELKQAEVALRTSEMLRRANAELERAARAKDEFLATMSHELRTPLNSILGYSEILLEEIRGPVNSHQRSALHQIVSSGEHLLNLITEILDLSKVEAGRLELQLTPVSISEVCQASLLFVRELALKKSVKLSLSVSDQLKNVEADPKRLKQMLINLLSNAVKFTPSGGRVELEAVADVAAGLVHFSVTDTGIGIPPEDLGRLFRPFVQLDSSLNRQHEGTGLGLALVRRLAELHGGSVAVESDFGKGSRFTITIPASSSRAARATP